MILWKMWYVKMYTIKPKGYIKTVIVIKSAKEVKMESQIIINLEEWKKGERIKQRTDGANRKEIERWQTTLTISTITLNANGLNTPIKRQTVRFNFSKSMAYMSIYQKHNLNIKEQIV